MIPKTLLTVISLLGVACGSEVVSCAVGNTDGICLPLRHKDGAPVCPEGLTSCGDKCITPDIACCDGGAHTCPRGNACAPPPLNCAEAETTSLGRPGDQVLPTTAADFTLPGPPETTASEPKETVSSSIAYPSDTTSNAPIPSGTTSSSKTSESPETSTTVTMVSATPSEAEPTNDKGHIVGSSVAWALVTVLIAFRCFC